MEFSIERASGEDAEMMADIIEKVWEHIDNKHWFIADDSEYTTRILKEGSSLGYKAVEKDSGAVAGVFIVVLPGMKEENLGRDIGLAQEELKKVAHMESVAILPSYRGNGLQYSMMQRGEADLKKMGYKYLMCTVHPDNYYSRNNVIRQGYEVVLTKEKYGGYIRDILLKKLF